MDLTTYPERELTKFEKFIYKCLDDMYIGGNPFAIEVTSIYGHDFYYHYKNPIMNTLIYYSPTINEALAAEGMVEINVVTKKGPTGKRTQVKIGKFLGKAFPFLQDADKEGLVISTQDAHKPFEGEYNIVTTGFADVVTMKSARSTHFGTSRRYKNLNNSCMRHSAEELGLDRHPYEAYDSGDFQLAYVTQGDKLAGRVVVHPKSKTYSAIYGTSQGAVTFLENKMREHKCTPVDDEGDDWEGAKFLHIETTYNNEDEEIEDMHVILAPYLDFWETSNGFTDGSYIELLLQKPNDGRLVVDMQDGGGFNEW